MLKLFRYSNAFLRLCESKRFANIATFNKSSLNAINKLSVLLGTNKLWKRYYNELQHEEIKSTSTQSQGPDIEAITCGNPDLEQKLKVLILEAEVMRQDGNNVPSNSFLKNDHWEQLLKMPTRTARRKYLQFLFKLEKKRENLMIKKEQKRLVREKEKENESEIENDHIIYGLAHNNIFLRFYETTINHFYNSKLIEAIMFGQQLVVDCGYDKNMNRRENVNCAKQLMFLFADNRMHDDPFDLHFCNLSQDGDLEKALYKQIKTMYEPWFPLNIHQKSYYDIFPKEKLIYLTPHCREEMLEFDHDAVYIIGGLVDKARNEPLSLAKAKKEGLKMLKLPLDKYLNWGPGAGKNLTLNQVMSVLLDIKKTGDWMYAFRHVPKRKLLDIHSYSNITNAPTLRYDKNLNSKGIRYHKNVQAMERMFDRVNNNSRKINVKSIFNDRFDK